MKKVSYGIVVILLTILFSAALWKFYPRTAAPITDVIISSPLPRFLSLNFNPQITSLDIWQPHAELTETADKDAPDITAKSALSYDETTDQFLFVKNPQEKLPMASLTKVMTAIIGLENKKADDSYTVPQSALVGEDSMGLIAGEKLTLKDLLYGIFMHSANDAAETVASNYPAGRDAFVDAMNQKITALGLSNTHFTNSTGLAGDGKQYSTAYDLMVISRNALTFPDIQEVAATFDHTITQTATHQEYDLENETNLISSYAGVRGLKTGFTPEAGYCLITYLHYQGHDIIAVLLGSNARREEMKHILDYSLKKLGVTPPPHG